MGKARIRKIWCLEKAISHPEAWVFEMVCHGNNIVAYYWMTEEWGTEIVSHPRAVKKTVIEKAIRDWWMHR